MLTAKGRRYLLVGEIASRFLYEFRAPAFFRRIRLHTSFRLTLTNLHFRMRLGRRISHAADYFVAEASCFFVAILVIFNRLRHVTDHVSQILEDLSRQSSLTDRWRVLIAYLQNEDTLRMLIEHLQNEDNLRAFSAYLVSLLITLPDAHIAMAGAAELDNSLELLLLGKMHSLSRDLKDQLFSGYGPLSTFKAKIDISYALQLIPKELYISLKTINKIRNKFAHNKTYTKFDDLEIFELVRSLPGFDVAQQLKSLQFLYIVSKLKDECHMLLQ
jgi:hypothetical protein